MTTFTPGPWKVYSQYGEIGNITNSDGSIMVAQAQQVEPRSHEVRLANTHLIASAPDLLNLLHEAVALQRKHYGDGMLLHMEMAKWAKKASAAIAKAKGEQQ